MSPSTRDLRVGWWRLNMTFEGSSYVSTTGALSMPVDRWDAVLPEEMLTRLTRQHPNILLVGPATFTEAALRLIEPLVQHPIAWWAPAQKRSVPTGGFATLFIGGVDAADAEQQSHLCQWFDAYPGRVQVVSTAVTPLFPLIQAGGFLDTLYYRLNHVCVVSDARSADL